MLLSNSGVGEKLIWTQSCVVQGLLSCIAVCSSTSPYLDYSIRPYPSSRLGTNPFFLASECIRDDTLNPRLFSHVG